jgi:hypothetical protein
LRKRKTLVDATGRERKSSRRAASLSSQSSPPAGAHSHDQFCGKGRARESFFYADDWRIKFLKLPPEKNAAAPRSITQRQTRRTKEWESAAAAAAEALFIVKEWLQMHAGTLGEVPSITVRPAVRLLSRFRPADY